MRSSGFASPQRASIVLSESMIAVQGIQLSKEVTEEIVVSALGRPERIEEGRPPAPPGHRNNQAYFYDSFGMYWLRDHKTLLFTAFGIVFHPDSNNPLQRHTRSPFTGVLQIGQHHLDLNTNVKDVLEILGDSIHRRYGYLWVGHVFGHDFTIQSRILEGMENELADIEIGLGHPLFSQ